VTGEVTGVTLARTVRCTHSHLLWNVLGLGSVGSGAADHISSQHTGGELLIRPKVTWV
jgi:hypothetical protein